MMSYIQKRKQSFVHAFKGLHLLFKETPNARIHLAAAVIAIILGFLFRISGGEWLAIAIVIGLVISLEAVNSALERLSDYACNKKIDPAIKKVKDLAAAAVFIAALSAFAVGVIIFFPKIF